MEVIGMLVGNEDKINSGQIILRSSKAPWVSENTLTRSFDKEAALANFGDLHGDSIAKKM
jgi:hypothetical protein